jgi:GT2 family glycosyltransferase
MGKQPRKIQPTTMVDIVIPVYGNYEFVEKNLEFIRQSAGKLPYSVYITDDCSPNYKQEGIAFWEKIRKTYPEIKGLLVHKHNTGYGKSVNDAAKLGNSPYILIQNNDILLIGETLQYMVQCLEENKEVGITFPKLLFFPNSQQQHKPAGKIQHAGIVFDIRGNPYHIFLGWDADHPFVNTIKDYNACTGACYMVRRELWDKIGGYDVSYGKGYYEDIDFCLKVRLSSYKIRYLPMAVGYHYTNATSEKFGVEAFGGNESIQRNNFIFHRKWENKIPFDEFIYSAT